MSDPKQKHLYAVNRMSCPRDGSSVQGTGWVMRPVHGYQRPILRADVYELPTLLSLMDDKVGIVATVCFLGINYAHDFVWMWLFDQGFLLLIWINFDASMDK